MLPDYEMPTVARNITTKALVDMIRRADTAVRPFVRETPLDRSPYLSSDRIDVFLKKENLQQTGSFKVRGAVNKLVALSDSDKRRGVVAASTGNHGAAVAYAGHHLGIPVTVYVPEQADASKVASIRIWGADVRHHGDDGLVTENFARAYADERGQTYVSPYNDPLVVAGQGTIGAEMLRQSDPMDFLFVAVGGGGLAAGLAAYLKSLAPSTVMVGCSPENSAVMIESIRAGRVLDLPSKPTLSDGTAGGVEADAITFEWCRTLVDEFVTVPEDEIARTLAEFVDTHHMLIEGSAAVALAALQSMRSELGSGRVAVVLCGANIGIATLRDVLAGRH